MEKILSKSDSFKEEYSCSVVKINELIPVESSDFLVKTNILGTQIVINKNLFKEGDIVFYASNETALNERFLSINNLFEIGCREKNANYEEVKSIMDDYDKNYNVILLSFVGCCSKLIKNSLISCKYFDFILLEIILRVILITT